MMNVETAILILKDYINTDRQIRNHRTESDFEQFCETTCMAIETLLNEIIEGNQEDIKELIETAHNWQNSYLDLKEKIHQKLIREQKMYSDRAVDVLQELLNEIEDK